MFDIHHLKPSFKIILIILISTNLIYLTYHHYQHHQSKFRRIDPSRTDLLKLKYKYEEKQNLTTLLTSSVTRTSHQPQQLLHSNKTNFNKTQDQSKDKKIYLRNINFCLYFNHCPSNNYTLDTFQPPPQCPFRCTFIKKIHDNLQPPNISATLRSRFGFEGQIFDDKIKSNWTVDDVHNDPTPHDMWTIYSSVESPYHVEVYRQANFSLERNILMNFWRGADFRWPYFSWTYYNPDIKRKKQEEDYWSGKSKLAAIFVSNCDYTYNNRPGFLKGLKDHMDVDVYGECGTLKCDGVECEVMLKRDYFFYLAFENANCRDYITEKFYRAVINGVIPVVFGAHPDDYLDLVPHGSYIHVEDFRNIQALATYLVHVSQSPTLYNRYFEWVETGSFQFHLKYYPSKSNLPCQLCTWLHNMDNMGKKPVKNKDQKRINFIQDLCLPKNQWYWNWKPRNVHFFNYLFFY